MREFSGVFLARMDLPIHVWHMVKVLQRDFNERQLIHVPMLNVCSIQPMEAVAEHNGVSYPSVSDSRYVFTYVAQSIDDFFFLKEEAGLAENPIPFDEDEGFEETMTTSAPQQPRVLEVRPALRSVGYLQNLSTARQMRSSG